MNFFSQEIVNGLVTGSSYALVALGFTLLLGILRVLNLAHPEILMWGAFVALIAADAGWPVWAVALAAMAGSVLWGLAIDRAVLSRLRNSSPHTPFIATMGVSMFMQNAAVAVFGPAPRAMPVLIPQSTISVGGITVSAAQMVTFGGAICMLAALWYLVERTWLGRAIRATSENAEAAQALGVNTEKVNAVTIAIASALAGAAGFLIATLYNQVFAFMGVSIGLKAMVVMLAGGLGNVVGAVVGGYGLGVLESLVTGYLASSYRDAVAFTALILILMVRPRGIFGERLRRK